MSESEPQVEHLFFPGYTFKSPKTWNPEEIFVRMPDGEIISTQSSQQIHDTDNQAESLIIDTQQIRKESINPGWEFPLVVNKFKEVCDRIGKDNGDIFADKYKISLVDLDSLIPSDEDGRQRLVDQYGEYVLDGLAGSFHFTEDKVAVIRIGYLGMEKTVSEDGVLSVLAHEIGHSLRGHLLEPAVYEEMKAYAFTQLFYRYLLNADIVEDQYSPFLPNPTHHIAQFRVIQLVIAGLNEEAILAHLTGANFGSYGPDAWRDMLESKLT